MKRKFWSEEEKLKLKELYEDDGLAPSEISLILNRTVSSISIKIQRWGFKHSLEQTSLIKSRLLSGENNPMYQKKAWSNGLTKDTNNSLKSAGKKISKIQKQKISNGEKIGYAEHPSFGQKAWNNGLTKETDNRIKLAAIKNSITTKNNWDNLPEEEKVKRRKKWASQSLKVNKKNTSIELKIKELLSKLSIEFIQQYSIDRYFVDFYIPNKNLVIECLGDYWHANPIKYPNKDMFNETQLNNTNRDTNKINYFIENKINYLLLWENDINNNFDGIKNTVLGKLNEI